MNTQIQWFEKTFDKPGWTGVNGTIEEMLTKTLIAPKGMSSYILPVTPFMLQRIPDDHYILCPVYEWMERKYRNGTKMTGYDWQLGVTGTGYVSERFDGVAISRRELGEELGIIPNAGFTYQMAKVNPTQNGMAPKIIFASVLDINNVTLNTARQSPLSGSENSHIKIAVLVHGSRVDIQEKYLIHQIIQTDNSDGIKGVMAVPAKVIKQLYQITSNISQLEFVDLENQDAVAQQVHAEALQIAAEQAERESGNGSRRGSERGGSTTPRW